VPELRAPLRDLNILPDSRLAAVLTFPIRRRPTLLPPDLRIAAIFGLH
jgi:hypothetical protein